MEYGHYGFQLFLFFIFLIGEVLLFMPSATKVVEADKKVKAPVKEEKDFIPAVRQAFAVEPDPLEEEIEEEREVKLTPNFQIIETGFGVQPLEIQVIEERKQDYPPFDTLINDFGQTRIKLLTARKIAKQLGIKQKVNGKDQPRDWIVGQIEQRYNKDPDSVIQVLEQVYGQKALIKKTENPKNSVA